METKGWKKLLAAKAMRCLDVDPIIRFEKVYSSRTFRLTAPSAVRDKKRFRGRGANLSGLRINQ
jgi:hypothetical protein